ncbi:MAG: helix-turn-helix domain-containing protein [Chloroflexota bacterium]|nr:helix-turn-helix domain-containing protein [Chloroflexota bacterium]
MAKIPLNETEHFQPEPDTLLIEDQSLRYGFIQLPRLVLYARNLSRDAKLLYAVLLGYAWQEGRCFPGYHRLCENMQASENAVRKYMRELESVNLLRQRRRGLGKTNIYTLLDLRTSKIEVQEPQMLAGESRTSEFAVQEPAKSEALEPTNNEVAEPAKSEVKLETVKLETEGIGNSKFRKESFPEIMIEDTGLALSTVQDEHDEGAISNTAAVSDAARAHLGIFAQDVAREFNDAASLRSSTSRLVNLYYQASLPMEDFIEHLYAARSITKERTAIIRTSAGDATAEWKKNKMSYFFAVLEDHLGIRERAYAGTETENGARRP